MRILGINFNKSSFMTLHKSWGLKRRFIWGLKQRNILCNIPQWIFGQQHRADWRGFGTDTLRSCGWSSEVNTCKQQVFYMVHFVGNIRISSSFFFFSNIWFCSKASSLIKCNLNLGRSALLWLLFFLPSFFHKAGQSRGPRPPRFCEVAFTGNAGVETLSHWPMHFQVCSPSGTTHTMSHRHCTGRSATSETASY